MIGGDWNHELTAEGAEARDQWKAGGDWLQRAGLTDLRVNASQRRVTYVGARGEQSVLDHLLATPRFAPEWNTASQFETVVMPGHEVGHRALRATSWTGCMSLLGVRFTHLSVRQRANLLARNQARRRHDVAALIPPEPTIYVRRRCHKRCTLPGYELQHL